MSVENNQVQEIPYPPIKATRRGFLSAASAALISIACSPGSQPTHEPASRVDIGKQRLNNEVDKLPESPIKVLLLSKVKPLFQENPPKTINYDGLEIKVHGSVVLLQTTNSDTVDGRYTLRSLEHFNVESLYSTKNAVIKLPYIGLLHDSDKNRIPSTNLAPDDTFLIDVEYDSGALLKEGLAPVITITTPSASYTGEVQKRIERAERFVYIKEACSILATLLYTEETIRKMHELGLSTFIEARSSSGIARQAEAVIQAIATVSRNVPGKSPGRIMAAPDLSGYLLAYKAFEGTEINDPNNMEPSLLALRPKMQSVDLGSSASEILLNSFQWVLNTPEANSLPHDGNLKDIP